MVYLRSLSVIQTATATPVLIPDLTTVSAADARNVVESAALISGQIVFGDWASIRFKDDASSPTAGPDLAQREVGLGDHYEVQIIEPLIVKVGDQELTLGALERRLLSVGYELQDGAIIGRPLARDTFDTQMDPIVSRGFRLGDEPIARFLDGERLKRGFPAQLAHGGCDSEDSEGIAPR